MTEEHIVYPLANHTTLNQKYQILNVLNAGGFGITYLALDLSSNKQVVIKECMPDAYAVRNQETGEVVAREDEASQINFANSIENAKQEALVISKLDHPGVVKVYDMFDVNGTFYYVMEQIKGNTLYEILTTMHASGLTMPSDQAKKLLLSILEVLTYVHSQGVFHCDIKPGNIFVQPDGSPKLIDFGAVRNKTLQHQGLVQITPGYTPPEFYPGQRAEIGAWCDIYGLGCTIYELITGNVPLPADQRSIVDRNPKVASNPGLRSLYPINFLSGIDKAMSPDTRSRFYSAKAWIDYIHTLEHTSNALRTSSARPIIRRHVKKSSSAGTVFFILLLISAAIGWFLWKDKQAHSTPHSPQKQTPPSTIQTTVKPKQNSNVVTTPFGTRIDTPHTENTKTSQNKRTTSTHKPTSASSTQKTTSTKRAKTTTNTIRPTRKATNSATSLPVENFPKPKVGNTNQMYKILP